MQHFGRPRALKSVNLGRLLVIFGGPGANVRTTLPLQRDLDLEGSAGSRNRLFSSVLFRRAKSGSERVALSISSDFSNPGGGH